MSKRISLKAARVDAGYSQTKAAALVGVGKQTISNWETGKTRIDAGSFMRLCEVYKISPQDIFLPYELANG